jgi:cysteinyl-tRNA synthetase
MAGRKMAKSAGNFQRITELEAASHDPLAFRYLCLTARYARQLDYSEASLQAAATALATLRLRLRAMGPPPPDGPWAAPPVLRAGKAPARPVGTAAGIRGHARPDETDGTSPGAPRLFDRIAEGVPPLSPDAEAWRTALVDAVEDDLDMPAAIGIVHRVIGSELPVEERRWLILDADAILGLDLHRAWEPPRAAAPLTRRATELVEARRAARARHDFVDADRIRDELRTLGLEPVDKPDGSSEWRAIERD